MNDAAFYAKKYGPEDPMGLQNMNDAAFYTKKYGPEDPMGLQNLNRYARAAEATEAYYA
jgi:hypothetical protein